MKRISLTLVVITAVLAACGGKTPEPAAVEVVDAVVVNDNNSLAYEFARALNQARLLREDAAVEDLVGAETYEHDAYLLEEWLASAQRLATKVENAPLPGDKEKVQQLNSKMDEQLTAALSGAKAFDAKVRKGETTPTELAEEAGAVQDHIRRAAEEHAQLMHDVITVENVDMVIWDEVLPHHELAYNHTRALWHLNRMLKYDKSNADWKDYWKVEAAAFDRRLEAAEAALPSVTAKIGPAAQSTIDEIKTLQTSAKEDIAEVAKELGKAKPDFEKVKGEVEAARDEISKAQAKHLRLMEENNLKPYPQYDFDYAAS